MRIADVEKKLQEATIDCAILGFSVDLWTVLTQTNYGESDCLTCAYFPLSPPGERRDDGVGRKKYGHDRAVAVVEAGYPAAVEAEGVYSIRARTVADRSRL